MKYRILIVAATALLLSGCQMDGEPPSPPSGEIIGGICRGATPTLEIATGLKSSLGPMGVALVNEGAGYVNSFCSSQSPPTVTASAIILITIALTKFLPTPTAQRAVVPQSAVAVTVDWPAIRDAWVAAYARWNAA